MSVVLAVRLAPSAQLHARLHANLALFFFRAGAKLGTRLSSGHHRTATRARPPTWAGLLPIAQLLTTYQGLLLERSEAKAAGRQGRSATCTVQQLAVRSAKGRRPRVSADCRAASSVIIASYYRPMAAASLQGFPPDMCREAAASRNCREPLRERTSCGSLAGSVTG